MSTTNFLEHWLPHLPSIIASTCSARSGGSAMGGSGSQWLKARRDKRRNAWRPIRKDTERISNNLPPHSNTDRELPKDQGKGDETCRDDFETPAARCISRLTGWLKNGRNEVLAGSANIASIAQECHTPNTCRCFSERVAVLQQSQVVDEGGREIQREVRGRAFWL